MSNRNDRSVDHNSVFFQRLYDPAFARSNAISSFQMLPGLRGYWPMSTVQSNADVRDYSGNGLTLTRVGALYGYHSLAPLAIFDGSDYLYRSDGADIEISGTESYIPSDMQGITVGGWFRLREPFGALTTLISKWGAVGQYSYSLGLSDPDEEIIFAVSGDGTNYKTVTSTIVPTEDEWFFCVGRFAPGASQTIFVNNFYAKELANIPYGIFDGTAPFQISGNNGANNLITGDCSLCFVCAAALSDGAILALYEVTRAMFGINQIAVTDRIVLEDLGGYWLFENGSIMRWG